MTLTKYTPIAVVLVLGFIVVSLIPSVRAATELTPNLKALPASDIRLASAGGVTLLRFSTSSWNNGLGQLELRAGAIDTANGKQNIAQRIYSNDGTYRDTLVGTFVWHDTHSHFHFEDYATYTLLPLTNAQANRTGTKMTFCVMDTTRVNTKLPGASKQAKYTTCSDTIQGMSVGWGDTYGYQLSGQSIDITGLPDGDYRLKIEIDPKGRIIETDETDNVSTVDIRLANGAVSAIGGGGGGRPGRGN